MYVKSIKEYPGLEARSDGISSSKRFRILTLVRTNNLLVSEC